MPRPEARVKFACEWTGRCVSGAGDACVKSTVDDHDKIGTSPVAKSEASDAFENRCRRAPSRTP